MLVALLEASGGYIQYSGVVNSEISGNTAVGGIYGRISCNGTITNNFVKDSKIEGYDQVGGIEGYRQVGAAVQAIYSNAEVTAINGSAGGIIGYYANEGSSQADPLVFSQPMLQGSIITGTKNVGGLIGLLDKAFVFKETGAQYACYIDADLNGDNLDTVSLGFGSFDSQTNELENLFAYKYSTINGSYIEDVKDIGENQVVNGEQLKEQDTYTNRGLTTAYYNFSTLQQNKYPILVDVDNQEGIDLPIDPEESGISLFSNELPEETTENDNGNDGSLPNITAYAVDIDKINIDFK